MKIRLVCKKDCSEILNIYSQYIDTKITFEYTLPSIEEFEQRISEITKFYPYLVCEENGKIIGYAYAHRQAQRIAYQWNAELSVYIDKNYTSKGIGKTLYNILIKILRLQKIKTVYGCVTIPNEKSEKLHFSLGFKEAGIHRNTGFKNGKWHDVKWFEKQIAPYDTTPDFPISINKITKKDIESIINSFEF